MRFCAWIWKMITNGRREAKQNRHKASASGRLHPTEILDELHLSVARAAEILEIRRATLSDLIHGKASLSPEVALRIEKAFDVSMDVLVRMQAWYDSYTMRQRAGTIEVQRYEPE